MFPYTSCIKGNEQHGISGDIENAAAASCVNEVTERETREWTANAQSLKDTVRKSKAHYNKSKDTTKKNKVWVLAVSVLSLVLFGASFVSFYLQRSCTGGMRTGNRGTWQRGLIVGGAFETEKQHIYEDNDGDTELVEF
jgi:hypothetical protein